MSKAFTKEQDGDNLEDEREIEGPQLPPGTKNYITPAGAKRLRDELHELLTKTRPHITEIVTWAASLGDRSENADYIYNKRKLREIDRRIRFLTKRLEAAEVVDPTHSTANDSVRFGATVTIREESGQTKTYAIVGVDEIDIKKRHISWVSPLGSALLKSKVGDFVLFRSPKGEEELEIVSIEYIPLA
jgi:transcription elongation factor GreB